MQALRALGVNEILNSFFIWLAINLSSEQYRACLCGSSKEPSEPVRERRASTPFTWAKKSPASTCEETRRNGT